MPMSFEMCWIDECSRLTNCFMGNAPTLVTCVLALTHKSLSDSSLLPTGAFTSQTTI